MRFSHIVLVDSVEEREAITLKDRYCKVIIVRSIEHQRKKKFKRGEVTGVYRVHAYDEIGKSFPEDLEGCLVSMQFLLLGWVESDDLADNDQIYYKSLVLSSYSVIKSDKKYSQHKMKMPERFFSDRK